MRLTNNLREAFIRAVMDDLPLVDHKEEIRKLAYEDIVNQLPPAIAKIYNDKSTRDWIKTNYCSYGSVSITVPSLCSGYTADKPKPTPEAQIKVNALKAANDAANSLVSELRTKLHGAAYGCTTRKQLAELLPEFDSYLPDDDTKATKVNLPVAANIFSDFVKAGWPKTKKHLNKQITI